MSNVKKDPTQGADVPIEQQISKQKRPTADMIILKTLAQEVRGPDKSPSPFSFESKVHKLKKYVPLIELVNSEVFKKPILDALEMKATRASNGYVNLQDEKTPVVLSSVLNPLIIDPHNFMYP